MLRLMDRFRDRFDQAKVEVVTPDVVQVLSEEELIKQLPHFDGWIAGDDPASRRVLSAGVEGRFRHLVKWGVGTDNVDYPACRDLGISVTNTPGVFGREVADIAMNYVSGLARETFLIDREIRLNNAWPKPSGISLAGKTVALVGLGDIGRQTAKRLLAAEMRIIGYDPAAPFDAVVGGERAMWPDRVGEADFIVFTCPLNDSTRGMFNAELLPALKRGVRIVNVGRGPLIATSALIGGLRSNIVHSAALDVFEDEPLPPNSELRDFNRCIFGSHNASNTTDAVERVSHTAIDLMFSYLEIGRA